VQSTNFARRSPRRQYARSCRDPCSAIRATLRAAMLTPGMLHTYDGVAATVRGDTLSMLWKAPARVQRSRWAYDVADELSARSPNGILALMIILPTADPPDGPARAENAVRLQKLAPMVRRLVTVVIGDELWQSIVRTVVRAMFLAHDGSRRLVLASTIDAGITRLVESAGPATPSHVDIDRDVTAMYAALDVAPPRRDDGGLAADALARASGTHLRASPTASRAWDELARRGPRSGIR